MSTIRLGDEQAQDARAETATLVVRCDHEQESSQSSSGRRSSRSHPTSVPSTWRSRVVSGDHASAHFWMSAGVQFSKAAVLDGPGAIPIGGDRRRERHSHARRRRNASATRASKGLPVAESDWHASMGGSGAIGFRARLDEVRRTPTCDSRPHRPRRPVVPTSLLVVDALARRAAKRRCLGPPHPRPVRPLRGSPHRRPSVVAPLGSSTGSVASSPSPHVGDSSAANEIRARRRSTKARYMGDRASRDDRLRNRARRWSMNLWLIAMLGACTSKDDDSADAETRCRHRRGHRLRHGLRHGRHRHRHGHGLRHRLGHGHRHRSDSDTDTDTDTDSDTDTTPTAPAEWACSDGLHCDWDCSGGGYVFSTPGTYYVDLDRRVRGVGRSVGSRRGGGAGASPPRRATAAEVAAVARRASPSMMSSSSSRGRRRSRRAAPGRPVGAAGVVRTRDGAELRRGRTVATVVVGGGGSRRL